MASLALWLLSADVCLYHILRNIPTFRKVIQDGWSPFLWRTFPAVFSSPVASGFWRECLRNFQACAALLMLGCGVLEGVEYLVKMHCYFYMLQATSG